MTNKISTFNGANPEEQLIVVKNDGFKLQGAKYGPAGIDGSTNTLQTIPYEHHEIHSGSHYFISGVTDLSINNVFDMQFTTPDTTKWAHLVFLLSVESETEWYIYEGATINVAGTTVTPRNNDRNSSNVSGMTVAGITNTSVGNADADTATAGATEIAHGIIGAGKDGGVIGREKEIILKQNTVYCFRGIANAAGYISYIVEWYEHTNKN
jgi:hypothetical protein